MRRRVIASAQYPGALLTPAEQRSGPIGARPCCPSVNSKMPRADDQCSGGGSLETADPKRPLTLRGEERPLLFDPAGDPAVVPRKTDEKLGRGPETRCRGHPPQPGCIHPVVGHTVTGRPGDRLAWHRM